MCENLIAVAHSGNVIRPARYEKAIDMVILTTSDGFDVSVARGAKRIRDGVLVKGMLDVAGTKPTIPVPFTHEDVSLWQYASKIAHGRCLRNMQHVQQAIRAVQVACYLDDTSATIATIASKLLTACVTSSPDICPTEAFTMCAENLDVFKTVFSSKRIVARDRLLTLFATVYDSIGWLPDCGCILQQRYGTSCTDSDLWTKDAFETTPYAFDPSCFSDTSGIKVGQRGLATYPDVRNAWNALVSSWKGFDVEREDVIRNMDRSERSSKLLVESVSNWRSLGSDQPWLDVCARSPLVRERMDAAISFNEAVLAPILNAQIVAPDGGVRYGDADSTKGTLSFFSRYDPIGRVVGLIGYDLRKVTNMKVLEYWFPPTAPFENAIQVPDGAEIRYK